MLYRKVNEEKTLRNRVRVLLEVCCNWYYYVA